jgi:hypothetical protein
VEIILIGANVLGAQSFTLSNRLHNDLFDIAFKTINEGSLSFNKAGIPIFARIPDLLMRLALSSRREMSIH